MEIAKYKSRYFNEYIYVADYLAAGKTETEITKYFKGKIERACPNEIIQFGVSISGGIHCVTAETKGFKTIVNA